MAFKRDPNDEVMASINITPLTDVLLVLLIIFMITASAIQKERLQIPRTRYKNKALPADLVLSVQKDQTIFVGANAVPLSGLKTYLEKLAPGQNQVIIKADQDVPYGAVALVMDAVQTAGLNDISLATRPLETTGRRSP